MPYLFPSAEWVAQLKEAINSSAAYASSAKTWEGDFYFIVEPGGGITEPVKIYLDLWHGQCRAAYLVEGEDTKQPEFIIAGPLETYRQIFAKKLDPIQALMSRKLKLQGNMGKVMRAVKATLDLVNCAASVDTVFPSAS
ncbi:MAG: SCP2 sterol-binding domain-containing protein [Anaerolineae bacterium]|nr:SCP2 sterol-binding domain-containing protein [Anaerolineae bacterium]